MGVPIDGPVTAGRATPNRPLGFSDWHRRRPRFGVWAVEVGTPRIKGWLRHARRALGPLLLEGYRRPPHVTVFAVGFPCERVECAADASWDEIAAQALLLSRLGPAPFRLRLGPVRSFAAAPYFAVRDAGSLAEIRALLARFRPEDRSVPYTPHITVGLYRQPWPLSAVARRIRRGIPRVPPLAIPVKRLAFLTFNSRDIAGPLRREISALLPRK